jgi:hypothetical protein
MVPIMFSQIKIGVKNEKNNYSCSDHVCIIGSATIGCSKQSGEVYGYSTADCVVEISEQQIVILKLWR